MTAHSRGEVVHVYEQDGMTATTTQNTQELNNNEETRNERN